MKAFSGARRPFSAKQTASRPARRSLIVQAVNTEQLRGAKADLAEMIKSRSCNPIIVRLAWHDSGNYNKDQEGEWPQAGGATGSIRFKPEIDYDANKGLSVALQLLKPINKKHPEVSFADMFQMASAVAIEVAGGPAIPIQYGRMDAQGPEDCPPDGRHPGGGPTYDDGSPSAGDHLRRVFYRMGLNDRDIVALSGAHTLGRAFADRSGYGHGRDGTQYTRDGPGVKGGTSWTPNWLVFDNSYYQHAKDKTDDELLRLDTDACLFLDEGFKPFAEKYLADQDAFFADYTEAHLKLSELGVKWEESGPVTL